MEVMLVTSSIRDLIRDRNRVADIPDFIAQGRDQGMQTLEQHLAQLVDNGSITVDTASASAADPAGFELHLKSLKKKPRSQRETQPV
jgi:twitching motility protein PilT